MIYYYSPNYKGDYYNSGIYTVLTELPDYSTYLDSDGYIGIDTETTGLDPHKDSLICVQMYSDKTGNTVIVKIPGLSEYDLVNLFSFIHNCEELVFHNIKFDIPFLAKANLLHPPSLVGVFKVAHCTFIYHQLINKGEFASLQKVIDLYVSKNEIEEINHQLQLDKSIRVEFEGFDLDRELEERHIKYCHLDVVHLPNIAISQIDILCGSESKFKYGGNLLAMEIHTAIVLSMIQFTGMLIDKDKWLDVSKSYEPIVKDYLEELNMIVVDNHIWLSTNYGDNSLRPFVANRQLSLFDIDVNTNAIFRCIVNWDSPTMVADVLETLGVNLYDTESKGGRSSGTTVLEQYCTEIDGKYTVLEKVIKALGKEEKERGMLIAGYDICTNILNYRQAKKILTTYGESFIEKYVGDDNRIHCTYDQLGTATGRISSNKPNMQNIPATAEFRDCFIAGPGNKLVVADYSQIEIRIAADITNDKNLIADFENKLDPYSEIGKRMFNKPVSKKENSYLRQVAKTIMLGLNYGMGASKLASKLNVTKDTAQMYINKFKKAMPELSSGLDKLGKMAVRDRWTKTATPFNRKRFFEPTDTDDVIERAGKNTPIQGTNADIVKVALCMLYSNLDWDSNKGASIVNTIHDEIVVECGASEAENVAKTVRKSMMDAATMILKKCPVDCTVEISDRWLK